VKDGVATAQKQLKLQPAAQQAMLHLACHSPQLQARLEMRNSTQKADLYCSSMCPQQPLKPAQRRQKHLDCKFG
jgi:hypothetical protein